MKIFFTRVLSVKKAQKKAAHPIGQAADFKKKLTEQIPTMRTASTYFDESLRSARAF